MLLFELASAVVSLLAVGLTARRHPLCWPLGLVSVIAYAWVFIDAKLYSDALLQGAFGIMIVYGWLRWMQHLDDSGHVRVAALPVARAWRHIGIGALGALALGAFMHHQTDADLAWLDAALAAFSLVAQWWQAKRHAAAWWMWIAVDVLYVGEYLYKGLHITAVLYLVFVGIAIAGLRSWRRAYKSTQRLSTESFGNY